MNPHSFAAWYGSLTAGIQTSPYPVRNGWVVRQGDIVMIVAGSRSAAYEIERDVVARFHPDPNLLPGHATIVANSETTWTTRDLLMSLDAFRRPSKCQFKTVIYENLRFEQTPEVRSKVSVLRKKGILAIFMYYDRLSMGSA
ncbi:MAG: hypothetical protein HY553_04210 [Elusimicrobia bacterium]|nr:hypothetical protein [Elusimicrobiota bacterium]